MRRSPFADSAFAGKIFISKYLTRVLFYVNYLLGIGNEISRKEIVLSCTVNAGIRFKLEMLPVRVVREQIVANHP